MSGRPSGARLALWTGIGLCVGLAVLSVVVDAGEYPGLSRASGRAFVRGPLPLVLVAAINLRALAAGRRWHRLVVVVNLLFLAAALRVLGGGAPPFFWLQGATAALLFVASVGLLDPRSREHAA
jgi:hypothetical protein